MEQNPLRFDALILAGGRSTRLGGVPKQGLVFRGATLLEQSLAASAGASLTVVVGPDPGPLPAGVIRCREEPEFAGPAAAVAAGLKALANAGSQSDFTMVLACDMPLVSAAVRALKGALASNLQGSDGVMACASDGALQPLAGIYGTSVLNNAVAERAAQGTLINASMRSLLASLEVQLVSVPAGSTADVDTWDDAAALGVDARRQDKGQDRRGSS